MLDVFYMTNADNRLIQCGAAPIYSIDFPGVVTFLVARAAATVRWSAPSVLFH